MTFTSSAKKSLMFNIDGVNDTTQVKQFKARPLLISFSFTKNKAKITA